MLIIRANGSVITENEKPVYFRSYTEASRFIRVIRAPNYVYVIEPMED